MQPSFTISANGKDITALVADKYVSLKLTDESGNEADTLEIVLADTDPLNPIRKPPKGAELRVAIGYLPLLVDKGLYVVDEVEMAGWPGTMTIRARGAQMQDSKTGKSALQSQKTRSWAKGTKLGDVVRKIAKDHSMQAAVAKSLDGIVLPHIDQTEESDLSFLVRIAKKHDAFVKPGGGKLALIKRGEGKTASGEDMPTITLDAGECSRWSENESSREENGTVVAFWQDKRAAKRQQVSAGSGDPVRRLRHNYPDKKTAEDAAKAELQKRTRGKNKFTFTMPGRPDVAAECAMVLSGFHPDLATDWLVTRAAHEFTPRGGYTTEGEAEKPDANDDKE